MASRDEQRAELQAALDALDADDDGSDEIEFEAGGKRVRGSFRRVSAIAEAMGFKLIPDPPAETPAKGKAKDSSETDVIRRFRTGRTG